MKLNELEDKSILILGTGREGMAALKFLKEHFPNKKIGQTDQKDDSDYLNNLTRYQVIIKSPGIPYSSKLIEARNKGVKITSITKIFFDNFPGKIVGVTGTKGKSTTSSLIYEILKLGGQDVYLVGNIGKPALEILYSSKPSSVAVYELSSFQLEDIESSPHIAVVTNIYPEHLDHHQNLKNYIQSKFNITKYQQKNDYLIYNKNIPQLKQFAAQTKAKTRTFLCDRTNFDNSLLGDFNNENVNAAVLAGKIFNVSKDKIAEAIKSFVPLPHRLEFIGEYNHIKFYNDSLATIPQATIGALGALGENVQTLIVGGFDRGVDYSTLGLSIAQSKVKNLILFPTTGEKIWQFVCKVTPFDAKLTKYDVKIMEEAVKIAYKVTDPRKIVLLSPASTSFNLFKDYADRGDQFKKATNSFAHLSVSPAPIKKTTS